MIATSQTTGGPPTRYSLEVTPRDADAFAAVTQSLPPRTEVFIADLPDQEPELLIEASIRYRNAGFRAVPHLVARNFASSGQVEDVVGRLIEEAGVERVFALGGDRESPAGPFSDALDLIEASQLQARGIRKVVLACFPEGHPRIAPDRLQQALEAKIKHCAQSGLDVLLVSQFCFDARPLLDYARRLRAAGIVAPLRVGIAGPADTDTLLKFAAELGVGPSKQRLEDPASGRSHEQGPYELVETIARAQEKEAPLGIDGFHFFAFGSTDRTIDWAERHRIRSRRA